MAERQAYDYDLQVRYGEVGHADVATLTSLANWMQEAAGKSALGLGFGDALMNSLGLAWILSRQVLRIRRLPSQGEDICVRSWPSVLDRFAHRGYEVYDKDNQLIVSSGSAWSVMDIAARKLAAVPPAVGEAFRDAAPCDGFSCRALPRLAAGPEDCHVAQIIVRQDDLDINRHVNNAHYFSWLLEPLPFTPGTQALPALIDVTFRAECFPGEVLLSVCALHEPDENARNDEDMPEVFGEPAPFRLVHAIRRTLGDQEDVCRAVTWWKQNPLA